MSTSDSPVLPTPSTAITPSPAAPSPNAGLAAYVQQAVAALDAIEVALGANPPLSGSQKLHAAKLRKGGEKAIGQIGSLATQHQLAPPALPSSVMVAQLERAQLLRPLAARLAAFTKHVDDLVFTAQGTSWSMALQLYALLQRRAIVDSELAAALQPVADLFAYRHPSTKAPVGSPTKPQRRAVAEAKRVLGTVAGGRLANESGPAGSGSAGAKP
jgi:hypothetical protein